MFLKLCKHELKNSYRSFLFMYAVLLVTSFFISMKLDESLGSAIIVFIYGASMVALIVMAFVSVIRNYIKTMFSRMSYLTHTLPVKEWKLLLSKVLVSFLWISVSMALIGLSIYIISYEELRDVYSVVSGVVFQILKQSGFILLILGILEIFQFILLVFFAITITNTRFVPRYRAGVSLVIFFVLNYIISVVTDFSLSLISEKDTVFVYDGYNYTYDMAGIIGSVVLVLVICALLYTGCVYILKKHLEIE